MKRLPRKFSDSVFHHNAPFGTKIMAPDYCIDAFVQHHFCVVMRIELGPYCLEFHHPVQRGVLGEELGHFPLKGG